MSAAAIATALHERAFTTEQIIAVLRARDAGTLFEDHLIEALIGAGATAAVIIAGIEAAPLPPPRMVAASERLSGPYATRDTNRARRGMADGDWIRLRASILRRDGYRCQYCGSGEDLTCDHILPLVRGGGNDPENLTTACRPCNSSKGSKTIEEWQVPSWR